MSQAFALAEPDLDVVAPAPPHVTPDMAPDVAPHLTVVPEVVDAPTNDSVTADAVSAVDAPAEWEESFEAFWSYVRVWVLGFVVGVALLTGLPMWAYTGVFGDGVALGAFSGIWVGGGYGFIAGATQWYHRVYER